jgi:hypothetical protein
MVFINTLAPDFQFNKSNTMETNQSYSLAKSVASQIQSLLKNGKKASQLKEQLGLDDSLLTKLKGGPDKYPNIFSEKKIKEFSEKLKVNFEDTTSQYEVIKGWYKVFTLAFSGKVVEHFVKIDTDQNNQLKMFWDWEEEGNSYSYSGLISVRGSKLFIELSPTNNRESTTGVRNRYIIIHCGLFEKTFSKKQALSGMITRVRSNSSDIVSYTCLFIKLDGELLNKPDEVFDFNTSFDKIIQEVDNLEIKNKLSYYQSTFFDYRYYRDKEKKHCLTINPLPSFSLKDIPAGDIYQKERGDTERLAGLYLVFCNIPTTNVSDNLYEQNINIAYLLIRPDSTVSIKTDRYFYEGDCIVYSGHNILEIRAEAYTTHNEFENLQVKTDREFSLLMTFTLGDSKSLDFKWTHGVSTALAYDNSPIAMHEILVKVDRESMSEFSKYENADPPSKKEEFEIMSKYFQELKKEEILKENSKDFAKKLLKKYGADEQINLDEQIKLLLSGRVDNYIKSPRELDTPLIRDQYAYQIYLDAFWGDITKLHYFYTKRVETKNVQNFEHIKTEAKILFNALMNFQEAFKHGFKYSLLEGEFEKGFFDYKLKSIVDNQYERSSLDEDNDKALDSSKETKTNFLYKHFEGYITSDLIAKIKENKIDNDTFKEFPTDENDCIIKLFKSSVTLKVKS